MSGKGTKEVPFDIMQEAFDTCSSDSKSPGKVIWVDNPDATLSFFEIETPNTVPSGLAGLWQKMLLGWKRRNLN